jgi:hypothetical protein
LKDAGIEDVVYDDRFYKEVHIQCQNIQAHVQE